MPQRPLTPFARCAPRASQLNSALPRARRRSAIGLLLGLMFGACVPPDTDVDPNGGAGARPIEAPMVLAAAVEQREMVQRLVTTAVVESELEVEVVPRVAGEAVEILVEEGDDVVAGAVLARLEDREQRLARDEAAIAVRDAEQSALRLDVATAEARSRLLSANSGLGQAARDHERDTELAASGDGRFASVSAKALEASKLALERAEQEAAQAQLAIQRAALEAAAARIAVERAEVALKRAEVALSDRNVRAPFAGRVARRDLRVGQQAMPSLAAFVLTDLEALRVVFYRPQRELGAFLAAARSEGPALALEAGSDAWPGARFAGAIERVSPTVDATSGSFRVTARLSPNPEEGAAVGVRLVPGLLVRLTLVTDRRPDALAVLKRAVQREGESAFVLAVSDGKVEKVSVTEGYSDETHVELIFTADTALDAGDLVVTVGPRDLEDGSPVRLVSADGVAAADADAGPKER